MGWVVNATTRPLYPWEGPGTHCMGGLMGLTAGLDWKISHPPGFDPRTVQPVASRYTDWAIPAYNYCCVSGLSCDLQKLFCCEYHETLMSKFNFYGITSTAIKLIRSYLLNTFQRVIINDNNLNKFSSQWEEVKYGVPQGSILARHFYILMISQKRYLILLYLKMIRALSSLIILLQNK
jgi:hypothetical protein